MAIDQALDRAGPPPRGVRVDLRGPIEPMRQMFGGLSVGLALSVTAIFLLLTAYFQSPRLALVAVAAVPAVLAGVAVALFLTGTTLKIQSFMGAIMAVGVAVAHAQVLRKQTHSLGQGALSEWEEFTDTDLVVADNPSALEDGQEITIRPEASSVVSRAPGS
jgi:multidrug efflux pump subunit AcrB